jgi:Ser-tRNA(Ala) deacylase AlaX
MQKRYTILKVGNCKKCPFYWEREAGQEYCGEIEITNDYECRRGHTAHQLKKIIADVWLNMQQWGLQAPEDYADELADEVLKAILPAGGK